MSVRMESGRVVRVVEALSWERGVDRRSFLRSFSRRAAEILRSGMFVSIWGPV